MSIEKLRVQFRAVGAVAAAAMAAACGGGGGSDDPVASPPPNSVSITGKAVDGPLQGATACYDLNDNRACDSSEPVSGPSAADGSFTITGVPTAQAGQRRVIVNVPATAIDADTGAAVGTAFVMMTPATGNTNAVFVSPLTSLVQQQMDGAAQSRDQAVAFVQSQLGLAVSPLADFTTAANADNSKAANAARLVISTQLQQAAALAPAVGQQDLSGGTVTQANVDALVAKTLVAALPMIGGAATDPSLAGQTGAALRQAVTALAANVVTQAGPTVPEAVAAVGVSKLPPEPPASGAPEPSATLAALRYVSATEWYMRSFQSTAADNTPDANNLLRSYDVRTSTESYAYTPGSPVVSSWVLLNDRTRAGDRYWNGSTWRTCDIGTRTTGTLRDANGRNSYDYCDGYERGTTVRSAGIDIAGQSMESVLVNRIRSLPGGSSGVNFADWGPTDLSVLAGATFPAGSRLVFQTGTPLEAAYAYDVRDSALVQLYNQDIANGGDARSGSPACAAANPVLSTVATLEDMVARSPGRPCIFNVATNSDGTSVDPNEAWGLSTVSLGNVNGYFANLPTGTGNYYTNVGRLRIGFTGAGNAVTYLECLERRTNPSTRNCRAIGSGSYTITTLGDARVMSFSNPPAAAGRLTYERVFVERGGRVYHGYRNRVGNENAQVRLNMPAANAMLAQLGLPVIAPTDAPVRQPGAKGTNAALLRGVWAFDDTFGAGLLRFGENGGYVGAITDAASGTQRPGVELGWFEIDGNGAASRLLELDSDGSNSLSHAVTGATWGINASTLSLTVGGTTETVSRFPDSGTGIVGVWTTSLTDLKAPMFAFFPSGRMVSVHPYAETVGACASARQGPPGVEAGPYTFNAGTGALAIGPRTLDTTGCTGLWDATVDPAGAVFNSTVTIAADGQSAVFTLPEGGTVTMYRVAVQ